VIAQHRIICTKHLPVLSFQEEIHKKDVARLFTCWSKKTFRIQQFIPSPYPAPPPHWGETASLGQKIAPPVVFFKMYIPALGVPCCIVMPRPRPSPPFLDVQDGAWSECRLISVSTQALSFSKPEILNPGEGSIAEIRLYFLLLFFQ
jgi:hypothetical protein